MRRPRTVIALCLSIQAPEQPTYSHYFEDMLKSADVGAGYNKSLEIAPLLKSEKESCRADEGAPSKEIRNSGSACYT